MAREEGSSELTAPQWTPLSDARQAVRCGARQPLQTRRPEAADWTDWLWWPVAGAGALLLASFFTEKQLLYAKRRESSQSTLLHSSMAWRLLFLAKCLRRLLPSAGWAAAYGAVLVALGYFRPPPLVTAALLVLLAARCGPGLIREALLATLTWQLTAALRAHDPLLVSHWSGGGTSLTDLSLRGLSCLEVRRPRLTAAAGGRVRLAADLGWPGLSASATAASPQTCYIPVPVRLRTAAWCQVKVSAAVSPDGAVSDVVCTVLSADLSRPRLSIESEFISFLDRTFGSPSEQWLRSGWEELRGSLVPWTKRFPAPAIQLTGWQKCALDLACLAPDDA